MFGIGFDEIFVILLVFLMFFNPKEWPAIARKIGGFAGWLSNEIKDINEFLNNKKNDEYDIVQDEQPDDKKIINKKEKKT